MSQIHLRHIKSYLDNQFKNLIDTSDCPSLSKSSSEELFLSRALAAFVVMTFGNTSAIEAANSLTDGPQDNGIDGIFYHKKQKILYLIQSKWSSKGQKTFDTAATHKFLKGFDYILDGEFNKFNKKILNKKDEIEIALNDANTQYKLMIIYTGIQNLPQDSENLIKERLNEINDISDVVSYEVLRQSEVHKIISQGLDNSPIDIDIMLGNWVKIPEPFESICGRISAKDVAEWRDQYYPKIFAPNIRCYLGNTEINDGIIETLKNQPEHFWYYNNGITALCRTVTKKMLGGDKSDSGLFECKDLHIINGAQTIGSVYEANKTYPDHVALAYIPIRLISLEKCPEQFAKSVTKYNNTQNKIDRRDFVSLDPEQERIKIELKFEDVIYIYKTGEIIPSEQQGFTLEDATIALACSIDISFAVRAKDKIGTLWDDINTEPYKRLFNPNTNSLKIWKLVQIMKVVEGTLLKEQNNQEKNTSDNRRKLFLTHASKLVLYLIFKDKELEVYYKDFENKNIDQNQNKIIEKKVIDYLDKVVDAANSLFPSGYPANICRNQTKCKKIISQV